MFIYFWAENKTKIYYEENIFCTELFLWAGFKDIKCNPWLRYISQSRNTLITFKNVTKCKLFKNQTTFSRNVYQNDALK